MSAPSPIHRVNMFIAKLAFENFDHAQTSNPNFSMMKFTVGIGKGADFLRIFTTRASPKVA